MPQRSERTARVLVGLAALTGLGLAACGRATVEPPTGAELYVRHCASCHGLEGRGDGPVAGSLVRPPTDLSRLAAAGRFDDGNLAAIIDGRSVVPAHGTREMPVWGAVFERELEADPPGTARTARLQIGLLVEHIRTLQR